MREEIFFFFIMIFFFGEQFRKKKKVCHFLVLSPHPSTEHNLFRKSDILIRNATESRPLFSIILDSNSSLKSIFFNKKKSCSLRLINQNQYQVPMKQCEDKQVEGSKNTD